MKWTTYELVKLVNSNNEINETIDLSSYIKGTDIEKITPVKVSGDFEVYDNEEFVFYLNIQCTLTMLCAISLKEVDYQIDIDVEETFTTVKSEDYITIEGITIDLLPIIWSNIILEKPMRVVSENAYDEVTFETTEIVDVEEKENAFASLKKLNK